MRGLMIKLEELSKDLKHWSYNNYGNLFQAFERSEKDLLAAENLFASDPSPDNLSSLNLQKAKHSKCINNIDSFWRQKANIKWIKEGEANTSFFHNYVKGKRKRLLINHISKGDDNFLESQEDIIADGLSFFKKAFYEEPTLTDSDLLQSIPVVISEEDNNMLTRLPNETEVKEAILALDPNSCAGWDGFNGFFFRSYWETIKEDVTSSCQEYFLGIPPPKSICKTLITLIPKVDNASSWKNFRPISLSSFPSKIITKILATRLTSLLPKIISREQGAFQKGKEIKHHILLAKELINGIDEGKRGGNVIIKLDMSKAFDRVSWSYLEKVLCLFGFSRAAISVLMRFTKKAYLSLLINGTQSKFFSPSRGLKQGDPLSPLLFNIASEGFSRSINHLYCVKGLEPYTMGRNFQNIHHLSYADDLLLFTNAAIPNLIKLRKYLNDYGKVSG
ncbi:unnamed protein product [Cuscuta campestris]|uniref:Reverse transcriptase domain-containing protein n=1 Tax=Cuscuta campestris TaxID=132261 RepID=A0A484M946_9ASTE|nr:unnamed protein product [Cuscuta campestris]